MTHTQAKSVIYALHPQAIEKPAKVMDIMQVLHNQKSLLNCGIISEEVYTLAKLWIGGQGTVEQARVWLQGLQTDLK